MLCKNAKKTGKTCKGGYSYEIKCHHSKTGCLRDCNTKCKGFEVDSDAEANYWRKIEQAQFGGCRGCGSEERYHY